MKRSFKKIISLFLSLLFIFLVFPLSSCEEVITENNRVFYDCFDTVCVVWDYSGMESEKFDKLAADIEASARHYHTLYDAHNEYDGINNIASLNRLAGQGAVKVDKAIIDVLEFSKKMYEDTDGKVNFALGSVTHLWKSLPASEKRIPYDTELSEAMAHTSPDSVVINRESSTVEILDPDLRIDLGAIAKGYTAEVIKEELSSLGYSSIVLDFGGNLCAVGTKPNGEGFESAIQNPLYDGSGNKYLRDDVILIDQALVTSGTYQRYYTVDGVKYHHIIDPESARPENRYISVSIQTRSSAVADALSTAIFNMDFEVACEFIGSYEEKMEVTFLFPDGRSQVIKN